MSTLQLTHFIDNHWVPSVSEERFAVIDPSTEEVIAWAARGDAQDVERAVQSARRAFPVWRDTKPRERSALLYALGQALRKQADTFARWEAMDSGKPLARARREILSTARYFEFYAGAADKFYGDTIPLGPDYVDFTLREPLGVTAHIVPWNFPLNMIGRSVAPALAMGNTAVVKPAEQTPITALKLAELMLELGFPPGAYNVVTGYGEEAGAPLSHHPGVDGITFTGSVEVGRLIMRAAAEHIRPVVLELGGKSPIIVFDDADPDHAAAETVKAIYSNTGQVCSAGSRLLVQEGIKDAVLEALIARSKRVRVGPALEDPDVGPLVSDEQYRRVQGYVEIGQKEGARLIFGGQRPAERERGFFFSPTILDSVHPQMRVAQEEIFGPVLAVLTFRTEEEALEIANGVQYGLVAGVMTNDIGRALRMARGLQAGQVFVNEYFAGGEETPFGGYKQSGFGREKGWEALYNYTQVKNVAIRIR